jgi:5,6-dimethylbenzimidazole synthase
VNAPQFDEAFRSKLAELFQWRRDVRHFKSDPLPEGLLQRLVREASLSPSVGYSQPWRFVEVRSLERRNAIIASFERENSRALAGYTGDDARRYATLKLSGLREAPVHLAVFCDDETLTGKGLGRATMPETLAYSATMAVYTFWLAARAEGVGAGWVSILEPALVTETLDVPEQWRLIAYLCVGYPKHESNTPELARAGWESPDTRSSELYVR